MIAGAMLAMQITDWRAERADRLAADRHGGDAGRRPAVDQRRAARHLRASAGASDVAYFVFYICMFAAVRDQLASTPAGQHRRPACRAICAARCPSSRSWSAPSRCSTTGCSSPACQSPLLIVGAGRGDAAGGGGPGVGDARSRGPASRSGDAPLRRAPDRAGAPLERHDRHLRRRTASFVTPARRPSSC